MKTFIYACHVIVIAGLYGCNPPDDTALPVGDEPLTVPGATLVSNNVGLIEWWVAAGADVNAVNDTGYPPLIFSIRVREIDVGVVETLLSLGADPDIRDKDDKSPLELAVHMRQSDKVKALLEYGASLDKTHQDDRTLLHLAAKNCSIEAVQQMLERGGRDMLYVRAMFGYPVDYALSFKGVDAASMILDYMDLTRTDEHGNNLLHYACIRGRLELIQLLVQRGMDINSLNGQGLTPLDLVNNYNPEKSDVIEYLVDNGAVRGATKERIGKIVSDETAFIEALKQMNDLNETDMNQQTVLHKAAKSGYVQAVRYLLENDADMNLQDKTTLTPLHYSIMYEHFEIAEMLIDRGAKLDIPNKSNHLPLDHAILLEPSDNKHELIRHMINKGAPINGTMETDPALFTALGSRDIYILELLIEMGADVNVIARTGFTPLHQTILTQNLEAAEVLLENRADITIKDRHGISSLEFVQIIEDDEIRDSFINQFLK